MLDEDVVLTHTYTESGYAVIGILYPLLVLVYVQFFVPAGLESPALKRPEETLPFANLVTNATVTFKAVNFTL